MPGAVLIRNGNYVEFLEEQSSELTASGEDIKKVKEKTRQGLESVQKINTKDLESLFKCLIVTTKITLLM